MNDPMQPCKDIAKTAEGHVRDLLAICVTEIEKGNKGVDADARDWWLAHYRGLFFWTLVMKEKEFEKDKAGLEAKARELARKAVQIADVENSKNVSRAHAWQASYWVDCPPQFRADWCN